MPRDSVLVPSTGILCFADGLLQAQRGGCPDPTASRWWGWDSNPGSLALKPIPFPLSQAASAESLARRLWALLRSLCHPCHCGDGPSHGQGPGRWLQGAAWAAERGGIQRCPSLLGWVRRAPGSCWAPSGQTGSVAGGGRGCPPVPPTCPAVMRGCLLRAAGQALDKWDPDRPPSCLPASSSPSLPLLPWPFSFHPPPPLFPLSTPTLPHSLGKL